MTDSLDRPTFTPKRVTSAQQPQLWPDRALPSHDQVQPLWGHTARMVVKGGPWDLTEEPELLRDEKGRVRRPYPGERSEYGSEPDPAMSSRSKTGAIVRAMWRAGWTREQAHDVLMTYFRTGGAYYWWRTDSEAFMDYLWTETPLTERDPYYRRPPARSLASEGGFCNSGFRPGGTAITETPRDRWEYLPEVGDQVVKAMRRLPPMSQTDLCTVLVADVAGVHPRNVRKYLTHLAAEGLLTAEPGRRTGRGGRPPKVWKIAPPVLSVGAGVDLEELLTLMDTTEEGAA